MNIKTITDEDITSLIESLNAFCFDKEGHGLPTYDEESEEKVKEIIRQWLRGGPRSKEVFKVAIDATKSCFRCSHCGEWYTTISDALECCQAKEGE